jgi:type I restriction enzyme R subunit
MHNTLSRQYTSRSPNIETHGALVLPDCALDVIKRNAVDGRRFSQMLAEALNRYQNRIIDAAQVIAEIVELTESPARRG